MSNYLVAIASTKVVQKIQSWFAEFNLSSELVDADIVHIPMGLHYGMLIVSRNARNDVDVDSRVYLRGYGINYAEREVIFGGAQGPVGAMARRELSQTALEGCYVSCSWDPERASIDLSNDLFGLCPMFAFEGPECVAFSDSVYVLRELRRGLNLPISLNSTAAIARSWANAMGGQMLSSNTLIDQIKMVPLGDQLRVTLDTTVGVAHNPKALPGVFSLSEDVSYAAAIKKAAVDYASLLNSLASRGSGKLRMSVSGGLDSRANIAAALLGPSIRENGIVSCQNSAPQHRADFEVVSEISAEFGLPLNRPVAAEEPRTTETVREDLGLWFLSSSAVYDFMVLPNRVVTGNASFNVGGQGAEMMKGQYGWRSVDAIARNIKQKKVAAAFRAETENALAGIGVGFDDPIGSEWHYVGHRNALHSGRFVPTSMLGFRPFMTKNLLALERSGASGFKRPTKREPSVINDLLIALQPDVAGHRFDDPHKNMTRDFISERLALMGGPLAPGDLENFTIVGSPEDVTNGHSSVFQEICSARGHWVKSDRATLIDLSTQGADIAAEHGLGEVYTPVLEEAMNKLGDDSVPLRFARGSIGKLLSFHLLR